LKTAFGYKEVTVQYVSNSDVMILLQHVSTKMCYYLLRLSVVFFSYSRQIPTYCLKSDYNRILLHPFQFIIQ